MKGQPLIMLLVALFLILAFGLAVSIILGAIWNIPYTESLIIASRTISSICIIILAVIFFLIGLGLIGDYLDKH